ncbi:MAG: RdgB/HAM1 family non-canonical purine NTP pyrophosphatase [Paludibacteraceae bacterium]|nr:RdgB/HAM1 family non-canonical purine NTP pyrophosphatase [Paludibacteraceae bacterium]
MNLVFATNNAHKLEEVRKILPSTCVLLSLRDIGFFGDIEETGKTLEDNSLLKARTIWEYINSHPQSVTIDGVFADDTGLEIRTLNNQPGVRTARWAGDDHNDAANRQKALHLLRGKTDRSARFRTVITLIMEKDNAGTENEPVAAQVEGKVEGRMAEEERGDGGFGYDSLFIPEGYDKTFAELPAETKNSISHRARAVQQLSMIL